MEIFGQRSVTYSRKRAMAFDIIAIVSSHVETVALLERKPDDVIKVKLDITDDDLTAAEAKGTYVKIRDYIWQTYQVKVSSLYIAQVKRELGMEMNPCHNKPETEGNPVPHVPDDKRELIVKALEHFKMVPPLA